MCRNLRVVWVLAFAVMVCASCIQARPVTSEPQIVAGQVRSVLPGATSSGVDFLKDVKPILDSRCVACHACYDAPCQLKATAAEGLARGATKARVYHSTRLLPAEPTRLFVDAQTTEDWRDKDFFSVFGELHNGQMEAGLIKQFLDLKDRHPASEPGVLPDTYSVGLGRENECPAINEFNGYAQKHPEGGMPYALPALSDAEKEVLFQWLDSGAPYSSEVEAAPEFNDALARWESFLNRDSDKGRLVSRYLYPNARKASSFRAGMDSARGEASFSSSSKVSLN